MKIIFITHLFASLFMTGLCWFVQIVHYPLFHQIKSIDFAKYEKKNFVTGFITIPIMVIEFLTGLYLLYNSATLVYLVNLALLGLIGLSTVFYQVPIHIKLTYNPSIKLIHKLILTNWIRTISWSVRMLLLAFVLFNAL
ncbi:MAG: hypothetical protein ACI8SA_001537 [Dokdonia sp.]|jgi:hypothetical protein